MAPTHGTIKGVERTLNQIYMLTRSIDAKCLAAYAEVLVLRENDLEEKHDGIELHNVLAESDIDAIKRQRYALSSFVRFQTALKGGTDE